MVRISLSGDAQILPLTKRFKVSLPPYQYWHPYIYICGGHAHFRQIAAGSVRQSAITKKVKTIATTTTTMQRHK